MRDQFIRQVKVYDNIFKAHELINEKHEDIKSLKCQKEAQSRSNNSIGEIYLNSKEIEFMRDNGASGMNCRKFYHTPLY